MNKFKRITALVLCLASPIGLLQTFFSKGSYEYTVSDSENGWTNIKEKILNSVFKNLIVQVCVFAVLY